ncbi:hypothetical protein GQ457_07G038140 [Hibiscus cannabinus]
MLLGWVVATIPSSAFNFLSFYVFRPQKKQPKTLKSENHYICSTLCIPPPPSRQISSSISQLSEPPTPIPSSAQKMSGEEVAVAQPEAPAALGEPMDINSALPLVVRKSQAHGGLARGLHEAAKAIEKHNAHLCILAEDCDQPDYVKLVKALCADHNVKVLRAPSSKTLGEWAGLCKIDSEGKARKVVGCSCVVVKDYGEQHEAVEVVQQHKD